jgi:hypothetical protein
MRLHGQISPIVAHYAASRLQGEGVSREEGVGGGFWETGRSGSTNAGSSAIDPDAMPLQRDPLVMVADLRHLAQPVQQQA